MLTPKRILRRAALVALVAATVSVPGTAQASIGGCPAEALAQVFLPWADPAWYATVPDGGLEAGGAGWSLRGGAAVVSGNEPYFVRSADDSRALALPAGAAASSPPTCIGLRHPTLRFFVRNVGAPSAVLAVSVEFVDPTGRPRSAPIGLVVATSTWQPSPVLPVLTNTLAPLIGQRATFKFTPADGGDFSVDDVYVDPYGKG